MRSTYCEIDLKNIEHNLNEIKKLSGGVKIVAIVKANAYGHGMVESAKTLSKAGVDFLGVAFPDEAKVLRKNGIKDKIMTIVTCSPEEAADVLEYDIHPVVSRKEMLKVYDSEAKKRGKTAKLHLFVNTGMNRDGIRCEEVTDFLEEASKYENIKIEGILTHFASSEFEDTSFADEQLKKFNAVLIMLEHNNIEMDYIHTANSAAVLNVRGSHFNMVRPGISLYGYMSTRKLTEQTTLKPVMKLKSKVLNTRRIQKGETAGYSMKYIADKDMNIAVVPMGYGDGYTTLLTNKGECLINGKKYSLIGSVCMDQLMVDLDDENAEPGDEVVFLGKQGENEISIHDLSERSGLIPYEIFTLILDRVKRVYIH